MTRNNNIKATTTAALLAIIVSAVSAETFPFTQEQQKLNQNRQLWINQRIGDYKYNYQKIETSNIVYPWLVQVRNNVGVSAHDGNGNQILWQNFKPPTFVDFFDLIQEQIYANAQQIMVTYDPQRGYPTNIYILKQDNTVHNSISFNFEDLTNLKPVHPTLSPVPIPDYNRLQGELNQNRQLWSNQRIVDYQYNYHKFETSSTVYPLLVGVKNGLGAYAQDGNGNPIKWPTPPTFDDFFNLIQEQISTRAQQINVVYDAQRGFPSNMYIVKSDNSVHHSTSYNFEDLTNRQPVLPTLSPGIDYKKLQEELNYNKANWERQQIRDYNYVYDNKQDLANPQRAYPIEIRVRNNRAIHGIDAQGTTVSWVNMPTLDQFFVDIQNQINSRAPVINVNWTKRGFPEYIYTQQNNGQIYHVTNTGFVYGSDMPNRRRALRGSAEPH